MSFELLLLRLPGGRQAGCPMRRLPPPVPSSSHLHDLPDLPGIRGIRGIR